MDLPGTDDSLRHDLQEVARKLGFSIGGDSSFAHEDFRPEVAGRHSTASEEPKSAQQKTNQKPPASDRAKPSKKSKGKKKAQKQGPGTRQG